MTDEFTAFLNSDEGRALVAEMAETQRDPDEESDENYQRKVAGQMLRVVWQNGWRPSGTQEAKP